ncbi:MAG: hypothetical protein LAT63_16380 [Marinobacter sp.]|nr:hypothetical protein [Marinobacter sp.]
MRSPILELESAIAAAPYRIAPEREQELGDWCDVEGVFLDIVDQPGFTFHVYPLEKKIQTSIASLEFLWSTTYVHLVLYDEYAQAQERGEDAFDTGGTQRSAAAIDLAKWAVGNIFGSGKQPWPDNFVRPIAEPVHHSDVHVANELFLSAFAWIMHHELAHIRLGHGVAITSRSQEEEKEADVAATRWILEKCHDSKQLQKRTYGVVAAILSLKAIASPGTRDVLQTHPPTFERIDYCLSEAGIDDDNEAYAFAACIMQIQLASRGVSVAHDGSSFKEIFSEYLIEFSKLFR